MTLVVYYKSLVVNAEMCIRSTSNQRTKSKTDMMDREQCNMPVKQCSKNQIYSSNKSDILKNYNFSRDGV